MSAIETSIFVAFDIETTGLRPRSDHIVELAAVRFRGDGTVLREFHQLIRPPVRIPAAVKRIHRISDADVRDQPSVQEVLPRFFAFLQEEPGVLVAHNAWFDVEFLWAASHSVESPLPDLPVVDSCLLARRRLVVTAHSLAFLAQYYHFPYDNRHRATADCRVLKDVFLKLLTNQPPINNVTELLANWTICTFDERDRYIADFRQVLVKLRQAIPEKQPVHIVYLGGNSPGLMRSITPIMLYEKNDHYYVEAHCHRSGERRSFRVDKIRVVKSR